MRISRSEYDSIYQATLDAIYKLIDNGEVRPGDKFPTERDLASEWGVSRNSIRDAFHILENRGLVVSKQGSGRFLRDISASELANRNIGHKFNQISKNLENCSLYEIYLTRQILEVKAVELVVKNATDEEIKAIRESYEYYVDLFNHTGNTRKEFEIHRLYTAYCGNEFLKNMIETSINAVEDLMLYRFNEEYYKLHTIEESAHSHGVIVKYIEARNADAASHMMYLHIQHTLDML